LSVAVALQATTVLHPVKPQAVLVQTLGIVRRTASGEVDMEPWVKRSQPVSGAEFEQTSRVDKLSKHEASGPNCEL